MDAHLDALTGSRDQAAPGWTKRDWLRRLLHRYRPSQGGRRLCRGVEGFPWIVRRRAASTVARRRL